MRRPRDVLGYSPADIVGVRVRDLVEPVDRDAWQALVGKLFDDPSTPVRGTFRCRHKDGIGALDRRRGAQSPAGAARRRHRRLLPRRHRAEGDRTAAEGNRRSIRPPVLVRGRCDLRSRRRGLFPFREPADVAAVRVRAGRSHRPPLHRVHPRRLSSADPAALLQADHRGSAELLHRVSRRSRSPARRSGSDRTRGS